MIVIYNPINMKEGDSNFFEIKHEHIPTPEEVYSIFKELTNKECKEIRKIEDEKGIYLLEVIIPGDLENEVVEYAYMRKGRYKEGESATTEIHVTYYDGDMPVSGTSAARCIDGNWVIL
jgi:hypothetical protein